MFLKDKFLKKNSFLNKPIVNADIRLIYLKLRKNKIIQWTKMKVDTKKSILLLDDYKIITFFSSLAKNILNYFACCDNFIKVKSIIQYYIRFSLASMIKQKHKISSLNKVFKNYSENINTVHPYKKDYKISFIKKNIMSNWPKNFQIKNHNIINYSPFKNIYDIIYIKRSWKKSIVFKNF